jgi:UDP-2,3-diacylglucosamine pyrophosphatase LpxH
MARYKSIFLSDTHMGVSASKVILASKFLQENKCDNLFLLGDIFDFWAIKQIFYWSKDYDQFIKIVLNLSENIKITYCTGNHDESLETYLMFNFCDIVLVKESSYTTILGKKILLCHGHEFDPVVRWSVDFSKIGNWLYLILLKINPVVNRIRRFFNINKYFSLAGMIKKKIQNSDKYIKVFEETMSEFAINNGYDGVICGHIHQPVIKEINNILYYNCGDMIDTLSLLVEKENGEFEIIRFQTE